MSHINPLSALPLNKQVERYLRSLLEKEEYQGKLLPTEVQLSEELGVARNTVRSAMDKLVREGLITRKKGVGTIVNRKPFITDLAQWNSFTMEFGDKMRTLTRHVTMEQPPAGTARELGLRNYEQKVLCLSRVKGTDGEPSVLLVSYFPKYLHIEPDEKFEEPLYSVLTHRYSARPVRSIEEIGAMQATPEIAQMLNIPRDSTVLFRRRRVMDAVDRLIELAYAFYRADRFLYRIELPWEDSNEQL